jgi:hypothetical protein
MPELWEGGRMVGIGDLVAHRMTADSDLCTIYEMDSAVLENAWL